MFDYPYLIELLTPKRSTDHRDTKFLVTFKERFNRIMQAGCGVSIPDNPMGQPRYGALECISQAGLSFDPEKVLMNLNTFHSKDELDELLDVAVQASLKYILVVRGDGGPLLSKLDPAEIGGNLSVATTIDLLRYIHRRFPDRFITGAAFNPYSSMPFELNRTKQKINAGARFIVTQPLVGPDKHVDQLSEYNTTLVVEAWMSENIDLLYKSVGKTANEQTERYVPADNLKRLHSAYPNRCVYLSMLSFKQDRRLLLPRLGEP